MPGYFWKKLVAAGVAAVALYVPAPSIAETITLKLAHFAPDNEITYVDVLKPFAELVNKESAGQVKIELYPNGALGRSLPSQPQLVLDGVADIAFTLPGASPGRFPDNVVMELPGLFRDLREATLVWTKFATTEKLRGYEDFVILGAFGTAPTNIYSNKPVEALKDLKGLKIRTTNATEGATLRELGMVPVLLSPTEIPEAIGRGTIDAICIQVGALKEFGWDRVTRYDYLLGVVSSPTAVLMNRKKFESLPPQAKAVFKKYGPDWMARAFIKGYGEFSDASAAQLKADSKRKTIIPSASDQETARHAYEEIVDQWLAKSPANAATLKKVKELIAEVRSSR